MSKKYFYISDKEWFETSGLKNPIMFQDDKLEERYPQFHKVHYDLKLLVTDAPTESERSFFAYNDYREKYGSRDIDVFREAVQKSPSKNVFLNGFRQEHFEYIAPFIKDTAEVLYLFKCRYIKDLSVLSDFKKLKCVLVFGNTSFTELWNMKENKDLTVVSLDYVTKIHSVASLTESEVEYFALNSEDTNGNKKECLISDISVFDKVPKLKFLKLVYKKVNIDY